MSLFFENRAWINQVRTEACPRPNKKYPFCCNLFSNLHQSQCSVTDIQLIRIVWGSKVKLLLTVTSFGYGTLFVPLHLSESKWLRRLRKIQRKSEFSYIRGRSLEETHLK